MKRTVAILLFLLAATSYAQQPAPQVVHPSVGTKWKSSDNKISIELIDKKQYFDWSDKATLDKDIYSPKSVNIHPDGSKFYVNSLEGCVTVVYDMKTRNKLKTIKHRFTTADSRLWAKPSSLYTFTHYHDNLNTFYGKPVESTFSHDGRYLWVPYYRRSYDINAQDPSAVAIIDTENDSIVKLMETGPLPKMVATSPDGKYVVITHWGDNTLGLINISSDNPSEWHHESLLVVDYKLKLNYSLTEPVDRDNGSGYALRGTVFTPDGKYLLVGCMGGSGGIAVVDMTERKYIGRILGMRSNVRHLIISNNYLYLSINGSGYVQRIKIDKIKEAVQNATSKVIYLKGWEECKVGRGARTIEVSPSGRYIFAACNTVSQLYVVDTQTMTVISRANVDSYPVGLDVSDDGAYVITTSQGRRKMGGNAVDIYKITYSDKEYTSKKSETKTDTASVSPILTSDSSGTGLTNTNNTPYIIILGAAVLTLICAACVYVSKRNAHARQADSY